MLVDALSPCDIGDDKGQGQRLTAPKYKLCMFAFIVLFCRGGGLGVSFVGVFSLWVFY